MEMIRYWGGGTWQESKKQDLDCFVPWGPVLRVEGQFPSKSKWAKESSHCFLLHTAIVSGNGSLQAWCYQSVMQIQKLLKLR